MRLPPRPPLLYNPQSLTGIHIYDLTQKNTCILDILNYSIRNYVDVNKHERQYNNVYRHKLA